MIIPDSDARRTRWRPAYAIWWSRPPDALLYRRGENPVHRHHQSTDRRRACEGEGNAWPRHFDIIVRENSRGDTIGDADLLDALRPRSRSVFSTRPGPGDSVVNPCA
jgi:hypothetical protein